MTALRPIREPVAKVVADLERRHSPRRAQLAAIAWWALIVGLAALFWLIATLAILVIR